MCAQESVSFWLSSLTLEIVNTVLNRAGWETDFLVFSQFEIFDGDFLS